MALRWDFDHRSGILTQVQRDHEFTFPFYEGNAVMITTNEFEEDGKELYEMMWFFVSDDHAKRCLGLAKRDDGTVDNMFSDKPITSITFYRDNCREWKKLADMFAKAFPDIVITVLPSRPDNEQ